jgi:hypothetical protein
MLHYSEIITGIIKPEKQVKPEKPVKAENWRN